MSSKISLILNFLCVLGLFFLLMTEEISSLGMALGILSLVVLAISSYTHYKNTKKTSLESK